MIFSSQITTLLTAINELRRDSDKLEKTYKGDQALARCNILFNIFKTLEKKYIVNDRLQFTLKESDTVTWVLELYDFSPLNINHRQVNAASSVTPYQLDIKFNCKLDVNKKMSRLVKKIVGVKYSITVDYLTDSNGNAVPLRMIDSPYPPIWSRLLAGELSKISTDETKSVNSFRLKKIYDEYKIFKAKFANFDATPKGKRLKKEIDELYVLSDEKTLEVDDDFYILFDRNIKDIFLF